MNREMTLALLQQHRLLAILRGDLNDKASSIARVLFEAGFRVLEISTVSPAWAENILAITQAFGDRLAVGAGTILNGDQVRRAADAGATFVVSPNTNPTIIAATCKSDMASFPGALTPTEIHLAIDSGADAVKLFPAAAVGPSYVRALRGPLPSLRLIPTGGIHTGNLRDYFEHGAWAVGIGSELVRGDEASPQTWPELRTRAAKFVELAGERL
jgi:Entner-Doudoroff aldolase